MTKEKIPQDKEKGNTISPSYELLRSEGSIIVNKALVHSIGLDEAVLYSELFSRYIYFAFKGQLTEEGFFFNTVDDLEAATCLKVKRQRKAISNLQELSLIAYKVKGMPARRYFKIIDNEELLAKYLGQGKQLMNQLKEQAKSPENKDSSQLGQNGQTRKAESAKLDRPKRPGNNTNLNGTKKESVHEPEKPPARAPITHKKEKPKSETQKLLDLYGELYQQETGIKYPVVKGKDPAILKRLTEEHGPDLAAAIVREHITNPDQWTADQGRGVNLINHNLARYLQRIKKKQAREQERAAYEERIRQQQEGWQREEEERAREDQEFKALPEYEQWLIRAEQQKGFASQFMLYFKGIDQEKYNKYLKRLELADEVIRVAKDEAAKETDPAAIEQIKQYRQKQHRQKLESEKALDQEGGQAGTG